MENQKNRDYFKWLHRLLVFAGICLLIAWGKCGGNFSHFNGKNGRENPEDTKIAISVVETDEESGENEEGSLQEGTSPEESRERDALSRGIENLLKGSVEMARQILARKQDNGWEERTDNTWTGREEAPDQEEEMPGPPVIYLLSDLHYMSALATDYGKAFETFEAKSDGKVIRYLPQVLDALLEETVREKPDALVLTGDITMNGERINHEDLARKLSKVREAGVQVLVIPGNHDINNPDAGVYFGEKADKTDGVDPAGFWEIYGGFGPDQAISRDEGSFSYIYELRDDIWLALLDTAQYEPRNLVEGMVRPGTMAWLEENLQAAKEQGVQVIVLGHHNLLSESRMFTTMCTLENGRDMVSLLERYQVPLYVSGHLHLQRTNQHKKGPGDTGYGIYEIVSDAVSIPPCQYGVLTWMENGDMDYRTRLVAVESWAVDHGETDENLLNFSAYGEAYIRQLVEEQIKGETKQVREKTAEEMARIYADVYADYCAGVEIDERERMRSWEYRQWENCWPQSDLAKDLRAMIGDCSRDYNAVTVPGMGGE